MGVPPKMGVSGHPRITFHAAGKVFDRLLKGRGAATGFFFWDSQKTHSTDDSLKTLKKSLRKKLGLKAAVPIHLVQLRNDVKVDLEDGTAFSALISHHEIEYP